MFKVNNRSGIFVNFEHISHLVLVFLLLTLNKQMLAGNILFEFVSDFVSRDGANSFRI